MDNWYVLTGGYTEPILMGSGEIVPGRGKGISLCSLDSASGQLDCIATMPSTPNPSHLTTDRSGEYLYCVNELKQYHGVSGSTVSAYRMDRSSGQMQLLSQQLTCGADACFVRLWHDEKWLFTANYSGGSIAVFPVLENHAIGPASCVLRHTGKGVNPRRQEGPHPHQILFAPDGVHIYVPDLGLDRLVCYRFDGEKGWLEKDNWPDILGNPGQGIRHGVFRGDGKRLYVMTEMAAQVNVYDYDPASGQAKLCQVCDTVDTPVGVLGAAIRLHPTEKWLYVSVRGADKLVVFRVGADGLLAFQSEVASGGSIPRDFNLTPDGKYLLAANQDSDNVCVYAIDGCGDLHLIGPCGSPMGAVTVVHIL